MKSLFACLFLLINGSILLSQPLGVPAVNDWDLPEIDFSQSLDNKIKAIRVNAQSISPMRGGGHYLFQSERYYTFNQQGKLETLIELESGDTTSVKHLKYTVRGTLHWETLEDRIWGKTYKTSYRYNRYNKPYQAKVYEVLPNHELMLLESRQYIHNADGQLSQIRYMERGHVLNTCTYAYAQNGLRIREEVADARGTIIRSTSYQYTESGDRLSTTIAGDRYHEYRYEYNPDQTLNKILWIEEGELKGEKQYIYDSYGNLSDIKRTMYGNIDKDESSEAFQFSYLAAN